ncbi:MAG: PIG-L family deacetylase [Anaerohalosphaeraceae bacterium]|nr:PIG-L family deacetylase [Anaerohalosphaeraceae bacterium]
MADKKRKSKSEVEFVRLAGDERRAGDTLASVSRHWQGEKESFLFISPHDDDIVLGSGLLIQLARRENVPVHILIVTDGSMGYCSSEEKDSISEIRKKESYECYEALGVPRENIIWLGFPDCQLSLYKGKRVAGEDDSATIEGYTGLQNAFTYWLRKIKPSQCFLPTSNDLHPDHKIVHEELLISLFHSAGSIWPELGEPIEKVPYVHELGVYCDFPSPPMLRMRTPEAFLEKKLEAILAFKSQKQIGSLVEVVRQSGPYEYLRPLEFKLYQPGAYYTMFEKNRHTGFIR